MLVRYLAVARRYASKTSRYVVRVPTVTGKRTRKFFDKREDAEVFAEQARKQVHLYRVKAFDIDDSLRLMAVECADAQALRKNHW
jgi:hypothetical protein